ncbi:envelope stress response membrane protein PspC [Hyphomonas sp.]|jgi:phage shock protein C|uniref:envelope stress response membrane protein PspC n=1 Tax=Hyphomonas sp. TaxID=87 RepID=UPI0025B899B0|nr:envelope stress response membrane protein PspC [Hyphomonas sp.]
MSRPYDPYSSRNPKRFFRSRDNSVIAGVCGGLAERFGWEPILVRVLTVLLTMFMMGPVAIIAYIVIWMITPRAPLGYGGFSDEEDAFWRGVSDRPRATFGTIKYTFMDLEERLKNIERTVTSEEWRLRQEFKDLEKGN